MTPGFGKGYHPEKSENYKARRGIKESQENMYCGIVFPSPSFLMTIVLPEEELPRANTILPPNINIKGH